MTRHGRRFSVAALAALVLPLLTLLPAQAAPAAPESDTAARPDRAAGPLRSATPRVDVLPTRRVPRPRVSKRSMTVYPVPTSSAGLRRITPAPNGDLWFAEGNANKIGRITTAGVITEFTLPATTTGDGVVKDLDVDSAGNVWVVWDTGWKVSRIVPSTSTAYTWGFDYPYGEEVRVGPGAVWVTVSYDEDGIVKIVGDNANWDANAPECDGALGRGRDGLMWCQQFDKLIQVNAAGTGGTAYPLPSNATYPYSVATGPTNKIWFGRDTGGTMFTSPGDGNVGWITNSNAVRTVRVGSRVAPRSLTTGADGNVWFASVGAAKGIGHLNVNGEGAVAAVGNYKPTSVAYGKDGNIWFTDADNNSVVRVDRDDLWVTNVNVGSGSQLKPHTQPKAKVKGKVDADKKRKSAVLKLACGSGKVPCQGKVVVKAGKKKVAKGGYRITAGSKGKAKLTLTAMARNLLKKHRSVKVVVSLKPAAGKKVTKTTALTR
ncbi:hypothetical protein [Nocardioides daejeonensis]|uniref:Vgb family protein n=1 Tax=Nocardioides daejeonensis TaxID=1046556 RepID=UPI000D74288E|nr:hypothetical protein [Nocardioides daejeonensis]